MKEDRVYNRSNTATAVLEKRCQGCGRQCPLNALACERGRRLNGGFSMEESHNSHVYQYLHKHEDIDFYKHDKRHCHHGMHDHDTQDFHPKGGKRHGHGEKRHLPFDTEEKGTKGLFARLRECGHYLFHLQGRNIGQNRIIRELAEQGGELSQREITEMLHLQRASVSEILGKLENRQLLQREQSETDKRTQMVKLTKEGRQMAESLLDEELKDRDSLFQSLTEEEKTQLHGILGKLLDSWRRQS